MSLGNLAVVRSWRPSILALTLGLTFGGLGVVSCGGDDVPTKADVVARLQKITHPPVEQSRAECMYDKIRSDSHLMRAALTQDELPKADDDKLAKIFARCLLAEDPTTTTRH